MIRHYVYIVHSSLYTAYIFRRISLEEKLMELHKLSMTQSRQAFSEDEKRLLQFHLSNLEYACGAPIEKVSNLEYVCGAPIDKVSNLEYVCGAPTEKVSNLEYACGAPIDKVSNLEYACGSPIEKVRRGRVTYCRNNTIGRTLLCIHFVKF